MGAHLQFPKGAIGIFHASFRSGLIFGPAVWLRQRCRVVLSKHDVVIDDNRL